METEKIIYLVTEYASGGEVFGKLVFLNVLSGIPSSNLLALNVLPHISYAYSKKVKLNRRI